jgi:hypothetical protein
MVLNNSDKNEIRELLSEELEKQLMDLKSEFFERIDPILKEVTTAREDRTLVENRLEALEEIHKEGSHSVSF